MRRKITSRMADWKSDPDHKPLLLTGCRQIGKTYSVREFGHSNYSDVIYINFEEMPEQREIFSGNLDHATIIDRIETVNRRKLRKKRSLLMEGADIDSLINRDPFANNGAFMENAVAAALVKKGYPPRFYGRDDSTLEIGFLINDGDGLDLLDVKSGRNKRSKSLTTLLAEKDRGRRGLKLAEGNVSVDKKGVVHLPLYGACFLRENGVAEIGPLDP